MELRLAENDSAVHALLSLAKRKESWQDQADGENDSECEDGSERFATWKTQRSDEDFLKLSHEFPLPKETAFQILTQRMRCTAPCRASASPIDRRIRFFYVLPSKIPGSGRAFEDSSNDISVSFQSIANSEPWWSDRVCDGNRLGIVARHMSRRTRVQSRAATDSSSARASGGNGDDFHGFQGRWFCLVQAPCHLIGGKQPKLKLAKAVPNVHSFVQVWQAPGLKNANSHLRKRKIVTSTVSAEQSIAQLAKLDKEVPCQGRRREGHINDGQNHFELPTPLPVQQMMQFSEVEPPSFLQHTHMMQHRHRRLHPTAAGMDFVPLTAHFVGDGCLRPLVQLNSHLTVQGRLLAMSQLLPQQQQIQPGNQTTFQGLGPTLVAARKHPLYAHAQDSHCCTDTEFSRSCCGCGSNGTSASCFDGIGGATKKDFDSVGRNSGVGSSFGQVVPTSSSTTVPPGALEAVSGLTAGEIRPRVCTYSKADEGRSQESVSGEGDSGDELDGQLCPSSPSSKSMSCSWPATTAAAATDCLPPLPAGPPSHTASNMLSRDAVELKEQAQTLTHTVSTLLEQLRKEQAARERLEQLVATHMVAPQGVLPNKTWTVATPPSPI